MFTESSEVYSNFEFITLQNCIAQIYKLELSPKRNSDLTDLKRLSPYKQFQTQNNNRSKVFEEAKERFEMTLEKELSLLNFDQSHLDNQRRKTTFGRNKDQSLKKLEKSSFKRLDRTSAGETESYLKFDTRRHFFGGSNQRVEETTIRKQDVSCDSFRTRNTCNSCNVCNNCLQSKTFSESIFYPQQDPVEALQTVNLEIKILQTKRLDEMTREDRIQIKLLAKKKEKLEAQIYLL